MKKTTKIAVPQRALPPVPPLPIRPGLFYSTANAVSAIGLAGRNLLSMAADSTGQVAVKSNGEVQQVQFNHQQWVAIGLPVALGTAIKGLAVYYRIVYPSGVRANTTRTYIVNPSLMEISLRGDASNLLSDTMQLNATVPTIYTTSAGLAANKKVVGPLTCLLQIVIGDPQDVILLNGLKLITA